MGSYHEQDVALDALDGRKVVGATTSRYSGSTPRAGMAAAAAVRGGVALAGGHGPSGVEPPAQGEGAVALAAQADVAGGQRQPVRLALVGMTSIRVGTSRSATSRRMTAACWASFWPK